MLKLVREPICVLTPRVALPRHLHTRPYATLVLEGGYEEAGERGRWRVRAGQVLIHASFSIHRNQSLEQGARLVNLPLPLITPDTVCGTAMDADLIARLAERDRSEAAEALMEGWRESAEPLGEAPDQLAQVLSGADSMPIHDWSERRGVARQTVFRNFRALYGVSPTRYRVEARARRAWQLIVVGRSNLIDAALQAGYVDQAHMTRDMKKLTGRTPGAWAQSARLHHSSKTAAEFA